MIPGGWLGVMLMACARALLLEKGRTSPNPVEVFVVPYPNQLAATHPRQVADDLWLPTRFVQKNHHPYFNFYAAFGRLQNGRIRHFALQQVMFGLGERFDVGPLHIYNYAAAGK